jgi:LSD1 subclass zinc finger protein
MSDAASPNPSSAAGPKQFPCSNCGAALFWDPGATALKCPYCGTENVVDDPAAAALPPPVQRELDFLSHLRDQGGQVETVEAVTVHCDGCGAEQTLREGQTAGTCAFCGRAIVAQATVKRQIKPQAVLPFKVTHNQAQAAFQTWIGSLWFAPGDLKLMAQRNGITGVYVPAWTYDANSETHYQGQRGDNYWVTETYTTTENGQSATRTRQVQRTRWSYASGVVYNTFDDVLVLAVRTLPPKADALEPWDLSSLAAYDDRYLSGFVAEGYTVDLEEGFGVAQRKMAPTIDRTIRQDIGGDHQRIDDKRSTYHDIMFKHLLLPMWISAYRYQGKTFNFLINARTGEVQGDRPWSAWKIAGLVLAILAVVVAVLLVVNRGR